MVSTIGYLPTSSDLIREGEFSGLFPSEHRGTLVKLAEDTMNLLSPLAQARTRDSLDVLLKHASPRYVYLQLEMLQVVWPQLRHRKVSELLASYFSHLRALSKAKSDLFGESALNQFLGALQSYEAFLMEALSGLQFPNDSEKLPRFVELTKFSDDPVVYAQMSISALLTVLLDELDTWVTQAIPVLASAADDYMTLVEDEFLARSEPAKDDLATVDYDAVRREFGL